MKTVKTQGIILKGFNYSDYDQILTVLTKDLGKIKVMARGVRRSKSKIRGGSQVFSLVQLELYKGTSFYRMIQTNCVKSFIEIRENYDKLLASSEWAEVLDKILVEEEKDEDIFKLALSGFTYIAYKETEKTLRVFEAKLLHHMGVLARETKCSICESEDTIYFTDRGDCLCSKCVKVKTDQFLDKGALKILCFFIRENLEDIERLKVSPKILLSISKFIQNQINNTIGKELKIFSYPHDSIDIKK
jgi:DNA repair protein RecO (recombination protein O)